MAFSEHGERTCDRCARRTDDWQTIDEAYICAACRAEIAADEAEVVSRHLRGAVDPRNETLIRLIRHGIEALRDGDGDATTARVTLANLDQLTANLRGAV